jgi:hypothetical protein
MHGRLPEIRMGEKIPCFNLQQIRLVEIDSWGKPSLEKLENPSSPEPAH